MDQDIVVCEPLRTPIGAFGGQFRDIPAQDLSAAVVRELLARTGLDPELVADVILGQSYATAEAPCIGRVTALDAGLPVTVPGKQVDRRCGSGVQAIVDASLIVGSGNGDFVIAGGVESMSHAPFYNDTIRWGVRGGNADFIDSLGRGRTTPGGKFHPVEGGMLETAENLRRDYSIGREEQDELAFNSHQRAAAAAADGRFAEEIVPITIPATRRVAKHQIDTDEHIRPDTNLEELAKLRPILGKNDPEATVTAGNASGQNDGAAAALVTTRAAAEAQGLKPLGRLVSWAVAGVPPETMGIGPVPATAKALERAGLNLSDIDLIELNEAFGAQALAVTREWGLGKDDFERLNVNGSGISLGHPVGATGGRILATMLREMDRRGARYGLETMCIGGGQGIAAIFERV